jgi:hypothetical protein
MSDAVEALGQHVHQEAPDKLVRVKPHRLPAARAVDAIVLPTERDAGVVGGNETAVPRNFPRTGLRLRASDGTLSSSIGLSAALDPRVRVACAGVTSKGGARSNRQGHDSGRHQSYCAIITFLVLTMT